MSHLDKIKDCTLKVGNYQIEYKKCSKKPWEVKRMVKALSNGRMMYDTGRKMGDAKVYETLNPSTRKLFGLEPLENFIPNWKELLPTSAELVWTKTQSIKAIRMREGSND
jgi:hypothetical protein